MKTIIAKNNWFADSDLRLDASFHLSEGHLTLMAFQNSAIKTKPLFQFTERIFYGGRSKRAYVSNPQRGLPFIKGSDTVKSNFSSLKYISKVRTANLDDYLLEEGWTLITRSGTIGNTAYVNNDFIGKAASDDIIRVVPKNIPSGFLYAFLSSKYGQSLLKHGTYGAVIQHIEPEHIENIPIPLFPSQKQEEIHNLIVQAANFRVEANQLLEEAILNFEESNDLVYLDYLLSQKEKDTALAFNVSRSNFTNESLKARNYSIRAQLISNKWTNCNNSISLNDYLSKPFYMGARASFKRISDGHFKGEDIISQGDIHKQNPKEFKKVKIKKDSADGRAKRKTVIMPSAGTLGENEIFTRPLLIRNNFENKLLSEVIGIFECKTEEDAAYLYAFLSTKACFRVLRTIVFGTNLLYPNWEFMKKLHIPICEGSKKELIVNKVLLAFDKRGDANNKENQAIQMVEKEIDLWQQS
jgi:restriction endonuclease S subunit